ncbi:hypothetical protein QL285_096726 [Trifolium repens]|nr:hypothetical protein QL285_096726 [Trifolium repens]
MASSLSTRSHRPRTTFESNQVRYSTPGMSMHVFSKATPFIWPHVFMHDNKNLLSQPFFNKQMHEYATIIKYL